MGPQQMESMSVKVLLKQVYLAHTTKITALENEIKELKIKLKEAESKSFENVKEINCKRCTELEEAFKSCKTALNEQSKWFENIGEKFSVFNGVEQKKESSRKSVDKPSMECNMDTFVSSKHSRLVCSKESDENKIAHSRKIIPSLSFTDDIFEKPSTNSSGKQNILKNVMNDCLESFDLCTVTCAPNFLNDIACLKSDSAVLVPDSLDVVKDLKISENFPSIVNNKIKDADCKAQRISNQQISDKNNFSGNSDQCQRRNKLLKKRLCSEVDSPGNSYKRCKSENESKLGCTFEDKKTKATSLLTGENTDVNNEKCIKSPASTETSGLISSVCDKDLNKSAEKAKQKIQVPTLDVVICKDIAHTSNSNHTLVKNSRKNLVNKNIENSNVTNSFETSPSLLPLNNNLLKPQLGKFEIPTSDNDDFQGSIVSVNTESEGSKDACENIKFSKKRQHLKSIKSTSKFKMTLDAPPLNYKKPSYKQTKLSKSIFQPKKNENDNLLLLNKNENSSPNSNELVSTPAGAMDFDATCIPDNFKFGVTQCGKSKVEKISKASCVDFETSILLLDTDFDEIDPKKSEAQDAATSLKQKIKINEDEVKNNASRDGMPACNEASDSFDRIPVEPEPNYKYKADVVRKKSLRKQLNAFDCQECEQYYADLGLSDNEKQKRLKKCSRHRGKFAPPPTPDHFWELDFPDTQECKARGYLNETQKVKLSSANRRLPL